MRMVKAEITKMSTDELEAYLDLRYETGAPQEELDALETEYAGRISEEDLKMTEDDPDMSEETGYNGGSLELELIDMYRRYLQPDDQRDGRMTRQEVISCMRGIIEDSWGINKGLKSVSNSQVLAAARDAYEYKRNLIEKCRASQRSKRLVCFW